MNKQAIAFLLVLALLVGCTPAQLTPIRRGEPVAIVFSENPQAKGGFEIYNKELGRDLSAGLITGTGAGVVAGILLAASCGPFAILCVPATIAAGTAIGTGAGAGVGAAVAATAELPNEKAAQLRDRLMRVQQSHPLLAELEKNVTDQAQKYWTLGTDRSTLEVTIELQNLLLFSTRDEQISSFVQVQVSVQQRGAEKSNPPWQKIYEYVSPYSNLPLWLDESSDFVDTMITSASQEIASQIFSDLAMN